MPTDPLSILGLSMDIIDRIRKLVQAKLVVVPKKIVSQQSDWSTIHTVTLTNKTGMPVYDIQLVLWPENQISDDWFEIDPSSVSGIELQNIAVNPEVFIVSGLCNNKPVKLIQFANIAARSDKQFKIKIKDANTINLDVVKFLKAPSIRAKKYNEIAFPVKPPFNMQLKSISVLMKNKRPIQ